MKMKESIASIAMVALLFASVGCRDRQQPAEQSEQSPQPGKSAESAGVLAERALAAMDRREFAKAAELYSQAYTAPAGEGETISDDQRFDWRCKAVLADWLATGDAEQVRRRRKLEPPQWHPMDPDWRPESTEEWQTDYLWTLSEAMSVYTSAGLPTDDPERMVVVLNMAAAAQAPQDRPTGDDDAELPTDWATLARVPRLLSAWAAMDAGRLDLADYQVVARLWISTPLETTSPEALIGLASRSADWQPPDSLCYVERGAGVSQQILQSVPVSADQAQATGDWIAWFGQHKADWQNRSCSGPLIIGVRRHPRVVASLTAWVAWRNGQGTPRLQLRSPAEAKRFAAGLKVVKSAMPDGATPVATRNQAEMVVATLSRFAGRTGLARVQSQDDFFWVLPAGAGGGQWIPLVAGWLAGRDWRPATGPPPDTQPEVIDLEATNPAEP